MIELYCKVEKNLRPTFSEKLSGVHEIDKSIKAISLCLTSRDSKKIISSGELAKFFASVMQKLANGRSITFLFPYDVKKVKKMLEKFKFKFEEKPSGKGISLEISPIQQTNIADILTTASSTTFYAMIDGRELPKLPAKLTSLITYVKGNCVLIVFSLFDETVEILFSMTEDAIFNIVTDVCRGLNIKCNRCEATQ